MYVGHRQYTRVYCPLKNFMILYCYNYLINLLYSIPNENRPVFVRWWSGSPT